MKKRVIEFSDIDDMEELLEESGRWNRQLIAENETLSSRITELESMCRTLQNLSDAHGKAHGAALARIAELEAATRWISVDERLPNVGDSVATISRTGVWGTIPKVRNGGEWFYTVFSYWMPLPQPPTEVTSE